MRPISIPPTFDSPRRGEGGFTLVELLVVVAIIGLVTAVAVIAAGDPRGPVAAEADRLAGKLGGARDRAIVGAMPVAVTIGPAGYSFAVRQDGAWRPWADPAFAPVRWREGTVAVIPGTPSARVWFDPIGMPSAPVALRLFREGARASVTIDMAGRVRVGD